MPTLRTILVSAVLDVAFVVVFAATGRASHDEAVLAGLGRTAWPFLAALAVGWLVTLAWRAPTRPARTGIGLWVITLAGGMLLRVLSGQGIALPFILVAAGFLLLTLVGWRIVWHLVARRRPRPAP